MRIHLISNLFSPDELAGAALYTDLARFLRDRSHDVRVTSTFSYYPAWQVKSDDSGILYRDESFEGIPVRRVRMHVPKRPNAVRRLLSDITFLVNIVRKGRFQGWTPDVVVTALPMLSQCVAQRCIYTGTKVGRMIVVQDFVVDAAIDLGILNVPILSKLLRSIERGALRSANCISTISPEMLSKLVKYVGEGRRCVFIPNWIHGSLQEQINKQRILKPIRDQKSLFYSGNLGVKQGLAEFLETYKSSDISGLGWKLAIHGGGAKRDSLVAQVGKPPGCSLGGILDEESYINALLTCSACLVTQRPGVGANFLPSKLLPAIATGTPVLAVCERNSPLALEVQHGRFGVVVPPDSPNEVRNIIKRWTRHPDELVQLGQNSLLHGQLYHRERILLQYEKELALLVS